MIQFYVRSKSKDGTRNYINIINASSPETAWFIAENRWKNRVIIDVMECKS